MCGADAAVALSASEFLAPRPPIQDTVDATPAEVIGGVSWGATPRSLLCPRRSPVVCEHPPAMGPPKEGGQLWAGSSAQILRGQELIEFVCPSSMMCRSTLKI